jgi:hypothetical protein
MYIDAGPGSLSLRPTDEVGEDGWQFVISAPDIDLTKLAQSEELIMEIIASLLPTEVTFNKIVWVSEFRCVHFVTSMRFQFHWFALGPISVW